MSIVFTCVCVWVCVLVSMSVCVHASVIVLELATEFTAGCQLFCDKVVANFK